MIRLSSAGRLRYVGVYCTCNEVLGKTTRDDLMDQLPIILDQTQNRYP